jgi:hypothetical protein
MLRGGKDSLADESSIRIPWLIWWIWRWREPIG